MRRGRILAAAAALLLVLLALGVRHVDEAPKGRSRLPRLPTMGGRTAEDRDVPPPSATEDPDNAVVVCRVDPAAPVGHQLWAVAEDRTAPDEDRIAAVRSGDDVILTLAPGTWQLWWTNEGPPNARDPIYHGSGRDLALGRMVLEAGDVHTCQIPANGLTVHGTVVNPDGGPIAGAAVVGCGLTGVTSGEDGQFTAVVALAALYPPDGTCLMGARWTDGLLRRDGPRVAISTFSVWHPVELEVDPTPIAGMGVGIQWMDGGIGVSFVHPDSPAERTGLAPGDLITTIDGTATAGMSLEEFVRRGTGPVGTSVTIGVEDEDGQAHTYRIRRERLERPGDTGR